MEAARAIHSAISGDPRVREIDEFEPSRSFTGWEAIYPHPLHQLSDDALRGVDQVQTLRMSDPIRFRVQVPPKNQPVVHETADVPTDTYYATWNGVTLVVVWDQMHHKGPAPISAGHIVIEVIADACEAVGLGVYRQGCSPGCDYGFIHTAMRVCAGVEDQEVTLAESQVLHTAIATVESLDDLGWTSYELWVRLDGPTWDFGLAKNYGQRVFDLERRVSGDTFHLLSHYHTHARSGVGKLPERISRKWQNRGWRREARALVSSVWLGLAGVEAMRQRWAEAESDLASDAGVAVLFSTEMRSDSVRMARLDTATAAHTAEHISTHLADRRLWLTTLYGTLSGAVAGAVVAALLT